MEYTVNVTQAGSYTATMLVANAFNGGTFHLELDGTPIGSTFTIPQTGSWDTFIPVTQTNLNLPVGTHVLRLAFDTNGSSWVGDLASLTFTQAGDTDKDFDIDFADLVPFLKVFNQAVTEFDWNGSGKIDIFEFNTLIQAQ